MKYEKYVQDTLKSLNVWMHSVEQFASFIDDDAKGIKSLENVLEFCSSMTGLARCVPTLVSSVHGAKEYIRMLDAPAEFVEKSKLKSAYIIGKKWLELKEKEERKGKVKK